MLPFSDAMELSTLYAALSGAGIPEDNQTSHSRQEVKEYFEHLYRILCQLMLLPTITSDVGMFISASESGGGTRSWRNDTWVMSDGKNLLFINPQTYADLKVEAYRVAALSLKTVRAARFANDSFRPNGGSMLQYVFALADGRDNLELKATGHNCTVLESFVTHYLTPAEVQG